MNKKSYNQSHISLFDRSHYLCFVLFLFFFSARKKRPFLVKAPEEGGRNPPNVTLDFVLEDLLTYFNDLKILCETKKEIEKKYNINKECDDCWPEDDIKRAWGKTRRIDEDRRRKRWSVVIVLQLLKIQRKEESDLNEGRCLDAQKESSASSDDQSGTESEENLNIRIPFTKLFCSANSMLDLKDGKLEEKNIEYQNTYFGNKLIDGKPEEKNKEGEESVEIRNKKCYVMLYDKKTNNAKWVYEILNKSTLPFSKKKTFKVDPWNNKNPQDHDSKKPFEDKTFVRGHLAAAANHMWCEEAYDSTYYISNITPQNDNLNNDMWKTLENYCRTKIKNDDVRNVHVYTGPLYKDEKTNKIGGKDVPSHYFKVIIVENMNGIIENPECYVIPNKNPEDDTKKKKHSGTIVRKLRTLRNTLSWFSQRAETVREGLNVYAM
ncbi:Endonuclease G, mitochondrial [Labeo rohita]|uniref:Endonuclease G, mitochondrial n=1 Tax=Labeo rohita TaxID=84645 RepID=A0ABQ8MW77_LABRO|nr:Endonuclease G, mitochondrial [Labeo rohita]